MRAGITALRSAAAHRRGSREGWQIGCGTKFRGVHERFGQLQSDAIDQAAAGIHSGGRPASKSRELYAECIEMQSVAFNQAANAACEGGFSGTEFHELCQGPFKLRYFRANKGTERDRRSYIQG